VSCCSWPARFLACAVARLAAACLLAVSALWPLQAAAQGIELTSLVVSRAETGLSLDFVAQPVLSKAVEDALRHGVPVYFVAQANVYRPRWYWRDERVARASRTWRLSFQPLTSAWRVSYGALTQSYPSLDEALTAISRTSRWKIAEADQIEAGEIYYLDFSYRLDNAQLPRPMQLDLAVQSDWNLAVERRLKLE
jgi:hypothetical protein